MSEASAQLVFAVAVATVGVAGLGRAGWPEHIPSLGIINWQTLSGSVLVAASGGSEPQGAAD